MLQPTTPIFRRRRGRPRRVPPGAAVALAVVSVEGVSFGPDDGEVTAVFNTSAGSPINAVGTSDPVKWTARFNDTAFEGSGLEKTAFNKVRVSFIAVGPDPGADVINYANAPSDIADALGRQLAAFSAMPL